MKVWLVIFLLFLSQLLVGQNLVPNPSFEDTVQCPSLNGYLWYTQNWLSFSSSPNFFHSCAPSGLWSVPDSYAGHQFASSGNAYIGAICYVEGETNHNLNREIIGAPLNSSLIIGTKYFISFNVCFVPYTVDIGSNIAINKLGARFSTVPYTNADSTTISPINNSAHIYTNSIISDTTYWTSIKGSFISDSSYNYIAIGNFFTIDSLDTLYTGGNPFANSSYYLFDDICVSPDSLTCYNFSTGINTHQEKNEVSVFPNPTYGKTTIQFNELKKAPIIKIRNQLGQLVFIKKYNNTHQIDLDLDVPNGVYFLQIESEGEIINKKIIKQ